MAGEDPSKVKSSSTGTDGKTVQTMKVPVTFNENATNRTENDRLAGINLSQIEENCLNRYHNYTYHWRMFLINDMDEREKLLSGDIGKYADTIKSLEKAGRLLTIVESGVTGYGIDEVQMVTKCADRNTTTIGFNIELTEPMGSSFLDKLGLATVHLGVPTFREAPWHLELTFMGYEPETGLPRRITDGQGRPIYKLWPVYLTDIKTTMIHSLTKYSIKAVPACEKARANNLALLRTGAKITASTLGEALTKLAEEMPAKMSESDYYIQDNKYRFEFHPPEMASWRLVEQGDGFIKPNRSSGWDKVQIDKTSVQFAASSNIYDIIDILSICTTECQHNLGVVNQDLKQRQDGDNGERAAGGSITDISQTNFQAVSVYPEVTKLTFRPTTGDYDREIVYHIHQRDISTPLIDQRQTERLARDKVAAQQRYFEFGRRLNKRYDYMYTGLNTEILSLDIKLDNLYRATLAHMGGLYSNPLITEGYFLDKEKIKVRMDALKSTFENNKREIRKIDEELKSSSVTAGKRKELELQRNKLESNNNAYKERMRTLAMGTAKPNDPTNDAVFEVEQSALSRDAEIHGSPYAQQLAKTQNDRLKKFKKDNEKVAYAENLQGDLQVTLDWYASTGKGTSLIIFGEDDRKAEADFLMSVETKYGRGRGIAASVLNQVYTSNAYGDMVTIDLEVRGDPYWLGMDSYELLKYQHDTISRSRPDTSKGTPSGDGPHQVNGYPNFVEAQHLFLLTFNAPKEYDEMGLTRNNGNEPSFFERVYHVREVTSIFRQGQFIQRLKANMDPHVAPASLIERVKLLQDMRKGEVSVVTPNSPAATTKNNSPLKAKTATGTSATSADYDSKRYDFIKGVEGEKLKSYTDTTGHRTVGVGFNMDAPGAKEKFNSTLGTDDQYFQDVYSGRQNITPEQSKQLFSTSVVDAEGVVDRKLSGTSLSENERIAMVSMAYNNPSLIGSGMTSAVQNGDKQAVVDEILYKSNGGNSKGIANRRYQEAALFAGSESIASVPEYKKYASRYA
jgi:GH24 family phage-related lysozyme (muramidase)